MIDSLENWTLNQREYGEKNKRYTIYYAAPRPYEVGFVSATSIEGRNASLESIRKGLMKNAFVMAASDMLRACRLLALEELDLHR